ncbi:MAG TPA: winged helix DNA-binding domain-containing protein [Gaiellaceae bacterium]|nr:winged helix DNA-binding domain-containing protein [Gaiellaceae bacterium]
MPRSTPRTLTLRELNRATLARQLLLERARLSVPSAVARLCAMQAQSAPEAYLGLWTRLHAFRKELLTAALERRRVVRATLFRMTLHFVSAGDHPAFAAVVHERWRQAMRDEGLPVEALARRIERLADNGTFTYRDAEDASPELGERRFRVRCVTPLVHVPPSGTWGTTRVRLTTAERWLGRPVPPAAEAAALVVRRYLGAFGPATRQDLMQFSGLRVADVAPALETLDGRLRRFHDDEGRDLVDIPRAPLPGADTPAPVRFLPRWDAILLSHADRARVLPAEYARAVITGGWVHPTFLVDGVVAGLWRQEDGKVKTEPFAPLPRSVRREVEEEAARLAAFLA